MNELSPDQIERIKAEQKLKTNETVKTLGKIYLKIIGIIFGVIFTCICGSVLLGLGIWFFTTVVPEMLR